MERVNLQLISYLGVLNYKAPPVGGNNVRLAVRAVGMLSYRKKQARSRCNNKGKFTQVSNCLMCYKWNNYPVVKQVEYGQNSGSTTTTTAVS